MIGHWTSGDLLFGFIQANQFWFVLKCMDLTLFSFVTSKLSYQITVKDSSKIRPMVSMVRRTEQTICKLSFGCPHFLEPLLNTSSSKVENQIQVHLLHISTRFKEYNKLLRFSCFSCIYHSLAARKTLERFEILMKALEFHQTTFNKLVTRELIVVGQLKNFWFAPPLLKS